MEYSFDIEMASKHGVNEAILIKNFQFWITKNRANNRHFHDGRTWTYNSVEAFTRIFPFWTAKQIRKALDNLIKDNIITTGNYNESRYDRTLRYAFSDESICHIGNSHLPK